ncbi:TIGR03643 family protein [Flavobacterium magnum]|uniref:TIGR03643 family protein n=1 Tax=Flavobacterium magnum TaxID=2162713 RepID=A0A2S0RIG3_9FLAO|nr:TIGR03643 family protein [Flavobacterium magnum]AWA30911.1 TIGR03643 family protein [Flavobacterium magnum]
MALLLKEFSPAELDRIIEMAWEDRTPFEAIRHQFGLTEESVKATMKAQLKFSSYKRWRQRVEHCRTKHLKKRDDSITRFRCSRQRAISGNRISKR